MFQHGPSCLNGPFTRERTWWQEPDASGTIPPEKQEPAAPRNVSRPADAPVRADLVARVRREIAAGTYDTPEKWESALERMFRRLEEDY